MTRSPIHSREKLFCVHEIIIAIIFVCFLPPHGVDMKLQSAKKKFVALLLCIGGIMKFATAAIINPESSGKIAN